MQVIVTNFLKVIKWESYEVRAMWFLSVSKVKLNYDTTSKADESHRAGCKLWLFDF